MAERERREIERIAGDKAKERDVAHDTRITQPAVTPASKVTHNDRGKKQEGVLLDAA